MRLGRSIMSLWICFCRCDCFCYRTSIAPDIEGDVFVNDNSDVTIVIPEQSYSKDAARTIVRFIDKDTFDFNPPVYYFVPEKEQQSHFAQFLNYNLNIEINKYAALRSIIDPVTGDEIKVQGDAQLNAGVDPGGNIVLAGNYDLDNGYMYLITSSCNANLNWRKAVPSLLPESPCRHGINITAAYDS